MKNRATSAPPAPGAEAELTTISCFLIGAGTGALLLPLVRQALA